MNNVTKDIVENIVTKNASKAKAAFGKLVSEKAMDVIETRKVKVAKDFFASK